MLRRSSMQILSLTLPSPSPTHHLKTITQTSSPLVLSHDKFIINLQGRLITVSGSYARYLPRLCYKYNLHIALTALMFPVHLAR